MKALSTLLVAACFVGAALAQQPAATNVVGTPVPNLIDRIADSYVKLVLAVGQHDPEHEHR